MPSNHRPRKVEHATPSRSYSKKHINDIAQKLGTALLQTGIYVGTDRIIAYEDALKELDLRINNEKSTKKAKEYELQKQAIIAMQREAIVNQRKFNDIVDVFGRGFAKDAGRKGFDRKAFIEKVEATAEYILTKKERECGIRRSAHTIIGTRKSKMSVYERGMRR